VARPPADSAATAAGAPVLALLKELRTRDEEVAALVKTGAFGGLYVPAFQAKDLALQIQARQDAASASQRQALEAHVKQLVTAAYQLDNYGDLGDAQKIGDAYHTFSTAVTAIGSLVQARP
jgi:hypothetical protein